MAASRSRKPVNKTPISRHPLFPATVALWFGALFGLGSMAVRPSLIEKAVLATGIHTIIPAAEPPLGATTQLLLALAMAGLGGVLGALLARRLARPKTVKRERKRAASSVAVAQASKRSGFGQEAAESASAVDAEATSSRRRQLAMHEDASPSEYHERAPLPGGTPQLLNVSEFDLEGFEEERNGDIQEFVSEPDDLHEQADIDWREHDDESVVPAAADSAQIFRAPSESSAEESADFASPAPAKELAASAMQSAFEQDAMAEGTDSLEAGAVSVPHDSDDPESEVGSDEGDEELTRPASPFEAPNAVPLFSRPADLASDKDADAIDVADDRSFIPAGPDLASIPAEAAFDQAGEDTSSEMSFAAPQEIRSEAKGEGVAHFGVQVEPGSASRILSAPLNELSHAELLERLAITLERSRSQQNEAAEATDPAGSEEGAESHHPVHDHGADEQEPEDNAITPHAVSQPDEVQESPVVESIGEAAFAPPPAASIPAALRPIDLEDDSDSDVLPCIVPPRHFSLSASSDDLCGQVDGQDDVDSPFGSEAEVEPCEVETDDDLLADEQDLEEGYSSLLSLSRSDRQQFVRIEEPEENSAEIKPFVVFPNDERADAGPFSRPASHSASDRKPDSGNNAVPHPQSETDQRRFDQPDAATNGDGNTQGPRSVPDPEETERSLRSALATLQRMSGAA